MTQPFPPQGPAQPNQAPRQHNPNHGPNWLMVGAGVLALTAGVVLGIRGLHDGVTTTPTAGGGTETVVNNYFWETTSVVTADGEQGELSSAPALPEIPLAAGTLAADALIVFGARRRG